MAPAADKFEMIAGNWLSDGASLKLPLSLPWPRRLKWEDGRWVELAETGINVFVLMNEARKRGYRSGFFLTLREGEAAGGKLKAGASGMAVASWRWTKPTGKFQGDITPKIASQIEKPLEIDEDETEAAAVALRPVVVFAAEEWENLPELPVYDYHAPTKEEALEAAELMEATEAPCEIKFGGEKALYNPTLNYIQMPPKESFASVKAYYLALFEQFGHALAGKHQMNLWEGKAEAEFSKDMVFRTLYARMLAAMLAYETGVDVLD